MRAPPIGEAPLSGEGVRLAIIDEGFHTGLGTLKQIKNFYLSSEQFIAKQQPQQPCPSHSHGTAVAAIAAGQKYSNYPGGVAPGADVSCFVCHGGYRMIKIWEDISKAEPPFDVISMSMIIKDGTNIDEYLQIISNEKHTIIFTGAGNDGTVEYPAKEAEYVVSVGAVGRDHKPRLPYANVHTYDEVAVPNGKLKGNSSAMVLVDEDGSSLATPAAAGLACLALEHATKNDINDRCKRKKKLMHIFQKSDKPYFILNYEDFMKDIEIYF